MSSPPRELPRELNVWHGTAIVIGTIIGSGIFLVPAEMMQAAGSAKLVYLAWLVGGLLSLFGAMTYAELGAMKPEAGGEYVYIRDAYGPLPAFLYGWTWFIVAKPASIATITSGIVRVLGGFHALGFLHTKFFVIALGHSREFSLSYGHLVSIACCILISYLNYLGVRKAGQFQLIFTALKIVMIVAIVIAVFAAASGAWSNFGLSFTGAKGGFAGFMAALVAALWAYDGWNDLNMVGGEMRDPQRTIPRSLISGVAVVAVLYMAVNAAVLYAMPPNAVAKSDVAAADAMRVAVGAWGAGLVMAGMAISMLVTLNGTIMSGARIPFALARDRNFFPALAEIDPKFQTPARAILVQAIVAIVLLIVGGAFRELFSLAIFSEWLFYMIATSTVFVFRARGLQRPFSSWGYPVFPALFVCAAGVLLYYTFFQNLRNSIIGLGLILAGIPLYLYFRSKHAKKT
ncbi:MAG: APC family permease [Terriglobales bacterium]|jgi:APA family basic amino acid/polyamine antiporter